VRPSNGRGVAGVEPTPSYLSLIDDVPACLTTRKTHRKTLSFLSTEPRDLAHEDHWSRQMAKAAFSHKAASPCIAESYL
jgi:hypothetical protein